MVPFFEKNALSMLSDSEKDVLGATLRNGTITQPRIVQKTGLAQQTVSRLVRGLIDHGALRPGDRISDGRRGQPSVSVELVPDFAYSIGVAIMTDAMSVVLMDFSGAMLEETYCRMTSMTRSAILDRLHDIIQSFIDKRKINPDRLAGLGIGISGYNFGGRARYNTPRALDDWALVEIDEIFSDRFGLPAMVENDGNAAAVGESLVGVGREMSSFIYLYIDAGIGGGVISNRHLMRGCNGNGGEVGLILPSMIYPHPNLELLRQLAIRSGVNADSVSEMLEKFDPDWPAIDEWINKTRDSLSLIASASAAILDPEAIVLGGRIPQTLARKVIPHIEVYDHHRRSQPRPFPRILVSDAPGNACAIGAAMLPFQAYFFSG